MIWIHPVPPWMCPVCKPKQYTTLALLFNCSGQIQHLPEDYSPVPHDFLPNVTEARAREWALFVHRQWAQLCRKASHTYHFRSALACLSNVVLNS